MRFVEETGGLWTAEQLRAAEAEIELQKREWEANRLEALQKEQEAERQRQEEDELLTYSRADAKNQVNSTKSKFNSKQPRKLSTITHNSHNNRTNRKRGSAHLNRDLTPSPPPNNTHNKQGGRAAKQSQVARKRVTSRSTVSNHSGSERKRRKSLVKRSPSVAPPVPQTKRLKVEPTNTHKSVIKHEPKVVRNSKARAALLTKQRREAAAARRMMLHKKALATSRVKEEDGQNDSENSAMETTQSSKASLVDDESSECSLDAMYDSNDDDNQSEEEVSKNGLSSDEDEVDDSDDEEEEDPRPKKPSKVVRNGKVKKKQKIPTSSSSSSSSSENEESETKEDNHFDINSPRSTRSRGTVKLNLWTLDASPIIPSKRRSKNNTSAVDHSEEPPTSPVPPNNVVKKSIANNATTTEAEDSCASVGSVKQAQIRDGFNVNSTPAARKKTSAKKSANPSSPSTIGGRHNTLDNWISKSPRTLRALSPMVMLNKDDVSRHMLPSPLAASGKVTDRQSSQIEVDPLADDGSMQQKPLDDEDNSTLRRTRTKLVTRYTENGQTG